MKKWFVLVLLILLATRCNSMEPNQVKQTSLLEKTTSTTITPTAISYIDIAEQSGFIKYIIESTGDFTGNSFELWLPSSYYIYPDNYWLSGELLDRASRGIEDYAYTIFADNLLLTASDDQNCSPFIDLVIRKGHDLQLENMSIENYAYLLVDAKSKMKWKVDQYEEKFESTGYDAWRIITYYDYPYSFVTDYGDSIDNLGNLIVFIDYIFKDRDNIWILTFSTYEYVYWGYSECGEISDDFDLIARTFKVTSTSP